jgi:hypothetical protein
MDDVEALLNDLDLIDNSSKQKNKSVAASSNSNIHVFNANKPVGLSLVPKPPSNQRSPTQTFNPKSKFTGINSNRVSSPDDVNIDDLLDVLGNSPIGDYNRSTNTSAVSSASGNKAANSMNSNYSGNSTSNGNSNRNNSNSSSNSNSGKYSNAVDAADSFNTASNIGTSFTSAANSSGNTSSTTRSTSTNNRCIRIVLSANHSSGFNWGVKSSSFSKA